MTTNERIRFKFENADGELEVESMWANACDDGYLIDNIPCYVTGVALGDMIAVEKDAEGMLWFKHLVRASGHSTIQVLFDNEAIAKTTCENAIALGCAWEGASELLVAVDVPSKAIYDELKRYLDAYEQRGLLEYQEACLGFIT